MRIFGCNAYVQDKQRGKLDSKAEYRLVGYSFHSRGFRLYNEAKRQVVVRRDVTFDESIVLRKEIWRRDIEAVCAPDENESSDKEVSGSVSIPYTNEMNEDSKAPVKSDTIKVKGLWLQRREPSKRVTKGKRPLTFEEEYGHGMSIHKAEEITLEDVTQ